MGFIPVIKSDNKKKFNFKKGGFLQGLTVVKQIFWKLILWGFHEMYFDQIKLPSLTLHTSFSSSLPTEWNSICASQIVLGIEWPSICYSMGWVTRAHILKASSPSSPQSLRAPLLCTNFVWVELGRVLWMLFKVLLVHMFSCTVVSRKHCFASVFQSLWLQALKSGP